MSVAAGWYDDPENPGRSRWWDGEQWAPPSSAAPSTPPGPPTPPGAFGVPHALTPNGGQPPFYGGAPAMYGAPGQKPPSYLVWAVLSTLLCCLPIGVASIVFAARVDGQWASGDHAAAAESSEKAKKFALASAGVSLLIGVLYVIVAVTAAGA